jgi:hypothetical protein
MNSKEFLLQECENVRATLQDVLRHDYAGGSSEEFYNEFQERLKFLESLLQPADPGDVLALGTFVGEVSLLSTIVHHMERSHSGEFPWPFTEYLRTLATPLCKEGLVENEGEPIIRVYAQGGLESYQINLENDLSVLNVGRRIFSIVFPRTLRHHVLLHAIFGHEIGHAAWTIPKHRADLLNRVLGPLRASGRLTSTSQATTWLRDVNAPKPIVELRNQYSDPEYTDVKRHQLDSWFQEFMCDLFGLVTFGGSFLAAHQTLLLALDPTGHRWGPYHPPYICRKAMLRHACNHLNWRELPASFNNPELQADVNAFVNSYCGPTAPGPWEDIFTAEQVGAAVDALQTILTEAGTSCFSMPSEFTFLPLVQMVNQQIPPCGSDLSGSATPLNSTIDFRHILFAGWLVADRVTNAANSSEERLTFLQLNKLCEMGLLQQRAIDLDLAMRNAGDS